VTTSKILTIQKDILKITLVSSTPLYTNSYFSINVKVYDFEGNSLEDQRGTHLIDLSVTPGTLSGTVSGSTSLGSISFTNLQITSSGLNTLKASCTDMVPDTMDFTITALALTRIEIDSYPSTSPAFTLFSVVVKAYDQTGLWTSPCTVTLTGNLDIDGDLSLSITEQGTFQIYCKEVGSLNLKAETESFSHFVDIEITKDYLKIESLSSVVRVI
jgi:hypothetical protein